MRTVGRIGWSLELTKVLTRSRGTPVAALARYWSRKVFVAMRKATDQCNPRGGVKANVKGRRERVCAPSVLPSISSDPCCPCDPRLYSPGNAGRGRDDTQRFLMMMPGIVASSSPPRPGGEPRWTRCGTGPIRVAAGACGVVPHGAAARTALLHFETRDPGSPGEAPEVPGAAIEVDLRTDGRRAGPRRRG